jgi:hypothetical protein
VLVLGGDPNVLLGKGGCGQCTLNPQTNQDGTRLPDTNVITPLKVGDTVRFNKAFLQSLALVSGPDAPTSLGPFTRRGTKTAIAPLTPRSSLGLATVHWADGEITQVNVVNLEQQPGNPPLLRP